MSRSARTLVVFLLTLCTCISAASAEIVKDVGADGTLTLESGKRVALAGVQMDTEGVSVLRVLAQKQDIRIQLLSNTTPGGKHSAYAYLLAKYLKFPVKPTGISDEQEILLNEFMIKIGAAKVADTQIFSHKAKFLKVQAEAKRKGEGVWSYEAS